LEGRLGQLFGAAGFLYAVGAAPLAFIPSKQSVNVLTKPCDCIRAHILITTACQEFLNPFCYLGCKTCFWTGLKQGKFIKTIIIVVQYNVARNRRVVP